MVALTQCCISSSSSTSSLPSPSSCLALLPSKLKSLSISNSSSSLSFSANLSFFSKGSLSLSSFQCPKRQSLTVVCEAETTRKADSAAKRVRQSEKRRLYNKARKSEVRTRMKKVLEALDTLIKKPDAQAEEVIPIEKLIAEAYSTIDKAIQVGTLHRNTGARRKSRLARRKKTVEIHHGWYTPAPPAPVETTTA